MNGDQESSFQKELEALVNKHSVENGSNTPDFILAAYLIQCLVIFNIAVNQRDKWYGIKPSPGWKKP